MIDQIAILFPAYLGHKDTFDKVFKAYYHPLKFFVAKTIGEDFSEDTVADLFVKLWNKNQRIESTAHLQAFLYRSARNICLDFLKTSRNAQKRHQYVTGEELVETENYLHRMIEAEILGEIYRAINLLPAQCSQVIRMSYIDGMTNTEIADQMKLAEKTVKNHKLRGLKILRDNLSGNALVALIVLQYLRS